MTRGRHPLGDQLHSEVELVVRDLRGDRPAPVSIDALAATLSVSVTWADLGDTLLGLTLDDRNVRLHRERLHGPRAAFVFAHEIAHVLRRRGHFPTVARSDEEWFADWFARELVLPLGWLRRYPVIELVTAVHAELDVVALQLAAVGRAPAIMRHRSRVLCRMCGAQAYRWRCECLAWRQRVHRDASVLPDVSRDLCSAFAANSTQLWLGGSSFQPLGLPVVTPGPSDARPDGSRRRKHPSSGGRPEQLSLAEEHIEWVAAPPNRRGMAPFAVDPKPRV